MTRAVIDTNLLLRMAAGGERSLLLHQWQARHFELIMSLATLTELRVVLARPEIQHYISPPVGVQFVALIEQRAIFVQPDLSAPTCRDPQDTALLATAVGGQADLLATADPDLLDDPKLISRLAERGIKVVRADEFLENLGHSA